MRNIFLLTIAVLFGYSCQKELLIPEKPVDSVTYVQVPSDTFFIRAFYGQQGLVPPNVGTVIFPQVAYDVPVVNKLAFMSAYTGLNGYGDSAGTIKKNALNDYNGEFYNNNINATPNARITIVPLNRPRPEFSSVSADSNFAYSKFFQSSRQIAVSISLVNGFWEHQDTATNKKVTVYQMKRLVLAATESVETGLATRKGVQKLINGQSEYYMAFVNRQALVIQAPSLPDGKPVTWYPHLY